MYYLRQRPDPIGGQKLVFIQDMSENSLELFFLHQGEE